MLVSWNSKMETGIDEIDRQHKRLFEIAEKLYEAKNGDPERLNIGIAATTEELLDYAEIHFDTEERMMDKAGFEGYADHKIVHRAFQKKARAYQARINERTEDVFLAMEIMNFLIDWIIDHISVKDQEYVPFIGN